MLKLASRPPVRHLRLGCLVRLAEAPEAFGGLVEALDRARHLAARELGDAARPVHQRIDLARRWLRGARAKHAQLFGGAHGALRLAVPRGVA
ncbi:MAG TPA: hypothetical protein VF814_19520 [Casimicrobiaceae bacterium]